MESERRTLELEREDMERVVTLYRGSNESLEALNQRMMHQIAANKAVVSEKDKLIKEFRSENTDLARQLHGAQVFYSSIT
jgi:hypothetical protein